MEKGTERSETHDFMNVESFSQLPFIRPTPVVKEKGIRLFGIEFGSGSYSSFATTDESESMEMAGNEGEVNVKDSNSSSSDGAIHNHDMNGESSRKFECHYCCRKFPTSQALGGHQNAHKRERQHAKRAHLQSALAHGGPNAHHLYGLTNYQLGSAPITNYHSWNNSNNYSAAVNFCSTGSRLYGGHHGSYSTQPINGSPLAFWRIPTVQNPTAVGTFHRDRSVHPLPLFSNVKDDLKPPSPLMAGSSRSRYAYEGKPTVQDHVSLDLHL